ncbi:hypothetical protein [[Clostridium] aminophilum]|uniref:Uncharacterized protein n=1 Tax=[Clostridium] aminophilum TaxID=1526 RepID=A0A1I6KM04_9FIRM|nr:hypothetical protein [[Clostridium] aminophilum]SFR92247.1 hypothetical protein SAMN02910262_02657 [[Clostridium] aminophilum]
MYAVSDAFLRAVKAKTRTYYWSGEIRTAGGNVYAFGPQDIVRGSGHISAQCCGSTELELGTVYAAEFGISLFSSIDRYTLKDASVSLFYHLHLEHGSVETVPMGIFTVQEANRTAKILELKGYDDMLRFEKSFNGFSTIGKPYDFLALCCKACKVEMAQTEEEIDAMPNGMELFSIYPENDIETCRDVLFYVGQILAGFFVINREGKLEIRRYGTDPVERYEAKHRFSSSFSDFVTEYSAVSSTNKRTEIAEYYALENDRALTMNLGINPLLQFGLKENRERILRVILAEVAKIRYVPFDSDTIGNPALDLGDVLTFSGGAAEGEPLAALTSIEWKIGGKASFRCVGKNPLLAQAKSRSDKNISGLLSQIEQGKLGIHTFTNATERTIGRELSQAISIQFAASEANHVQFFGQIMMDITADPVERNAVGMVKLPLKNTEGVEEDNREIDARSDEQSDSVTDGWNGSGLSGQNGTSISVRNDGNSESQQNEGSDKEVQLVSVPIRWQEDGQAVVTVAYEWNDRMLEMPVPKEMWHSGRHILNLYYPIENVLANHSNTFNVYLKITGGTGRIAIGDIVAAISGQSMAAKEAWDGKIFLEESVRPFGFWSGLSTKGFRETVAVVESNGERNRWSERIAPMAIGALGAWIETGG